MKQTKEAALRRELESRGTLPKMPDADELQRRAKGREPLLTVWEQNAIEGELLAFKSAQRGAYAAQSRVYRFPDDIRLAAARLARLAEAHGDDADKDASKLLQNFFANPGGTVRTAKLDEADEARIAAQILLERLADACEVAFAVAADSKAERAARELRAVFDTAKGRKDALRAALGLMGEAAAQWLDEAEGRTLAALVEAQGDKTLKAVKETKDALLLKEKVAIPFGHFQTQAEFASHFKEYGVTPVIVSRWRNGKEQPPKDFAWPCPYAGTDNVTYLAVKIGIKDWYEAKVNREKVRELKRNGQYPTARELEKEILGNNRGKNLNR